MTGPAKRSDRPRFRWWALGAIGVLCLPVVWLVFIADGWTVNRLVVWIWTWPMRLGIPMTPDDMDALLNTLMLLPIALLAALWMPQVRWWLWGVLGMLGSLAIEALQLLFLPRDASGYDLLFNTLGAFLGAFGGELINRRWVNRPSRGPTGSSPRFRNAGSGSG
ncbi:VanZ family protein [Tessaracoccus massiliensis]|uniref:VanZ family protein n=1 Tax=Tessaracoccus massiliensis TaxID=1522311 RepID=UPI00058DC4CC|nr:VanZ family protein [Tessaracoccus massiliensis]